MPRILDPLESTPKNTSVGHALDTTTIEGMKEVMVIDIKPSESPERNEKRKISGLVSGGGSSGTGSQW